MGKDVRPRLILSLPSSGSDWFARTIARHCSVPYFDKEFFNPITNWAHTDELSRAFACEMVSCHRNIGRGDPELLQQVFDATWGPAHFMLDKEVWSPCKLPFFAQHFRVVVLLRSPRLTFPPSRARVWAWYDALYWGLAEAGEIAALPGAPLLTRARGAHEAATSALRADAERAGVPIIRYSDLLTEPTQALRRRLGRSFNWGRTFDAERAAAEIVRTREAPCKTGSRISVASRRAT